MEVAFVVSSEEWRQPVGNVRMLNTRREKEQFA
jgi:hypothetical protein